MTDITQTTTGPEVPRWWTCRIHGDAMPHNAWGCPECVRDMRDEIERLRAALAEADSLFTICGQLVDAGHMNTEDLAYLRAALEKP